MILIVRRQYLMIMKDINDNTEIDKKLCEMNTYKFDYILNSILYYFS